ncbi:hypothetical protein HY285_02865 [Candidatus Peregrinibacteria bacterium]|nr:hypothetical protein [Candidatus Peregrinibacteria bacterium]
MQRWPLLFTALLLCLVVTGPINLTPCSGSAGAADIISAGKALGSHSATTKMLGGIILLKSAFPGSPTGRWTSALPRSCSAHAIAEIGITFVLFAIILAQMLAILIGNEVLHWEDSATTFFSRAYGSVFLKKMIAALITGLATALIILGLSRVPSVAAWAAKNTLIRSPLQAAIALGAAAAMIPLLWTAALWEEFGTVWDRLLFLTETVLFIGLAAWLLFTINLPLLFLSLPFPSFSQNFNPFFPEDMSRWLKNFQPAGKGTNWLTGQ